MAELYADENFALDTVEHLRSLGHDVVTALEAGQANRRIPDDDVLAYATASGRTVPTRNRSDFVRLHRRTTSHGGIIACTEDHDYVRQAHQIHRAIASLADLAGRLIRVYRGP